MERRSLVEETSDLSELVERVAALDLGKASVTACVRVPHPAKHGRRCQEVREYGTTTRALLALAGDLRGHGVTLVAMEATEVIRGFQDRKWRIPRSGLSRTRP